MIRAGGADLLRGQLEVWRQEMHREMPPDTLIVLAGLNIALMGIKLPKNLWSEK